jgi:hypothetical protein
MESPTASDIATDSASEKINFALKQPSWRQTDRLNARCQLIYDVDTPSRRY